MNDQLESKFKIIVDAITNLQAAVTAIKWRDEENIEKCDKKREDGDVQPNVSDDMNSHRNVEEDAHKDINKQTKINNCEDIKGKLDTQENDVEIENKGLLQSDVEYIQDKSNLQKSSECSLKSSIDTLNNNIRDLGGELRRFYTVLKDGAQEKKQCYVNWGAEHQVLYAGAYVARAELQDALWKITKLAEYNFISRNEVNNIINGFTVHKVTKHSRFPNDGVYMNIKDYDIYLPMCRLRSMEYNSLNKIDFVNALCRVQDLASNVLGDVRSVGVMFDVDVFEKQYNLHWN